MCLCPVKIINPKVRFSTKGFHPFFIEVPCGHCAECQEQKVNEYKVRAYYEALSTYNENGFVINDTLTYSNESLPHLSDEDSFFKGSQYDFPCFSYKDFRLFIVLLRQMAKERLNLPSSCIKYFMAAEYGTTQGKTHRPHYHVLFFVRYHIDPVEFSYLISDCWPHGRTDGVRYKGRTYFFEKRCFSRSVNNDVLHLTNVAKYVCKYLVKDSSFQSEIDSRLSTCMLSKFGPDWTKDNNALDYFQTLHRRVSQFHRNSQKFGLDALKYNDINEVLFTGMLQMKSSSNVIQHIPLPMYFKRKLFYELTKDFRGQAHWKLTPFGVQWKLNRTKDSIALLASRFASWYDQLKFDSNNSMYDNVTSFLNGRSWYDFATYLLCYKGRILPYIHHEYVRAFHYCLDVPPVPLDVALTLSYDNDNGVGEYYNYLNKDTYTITFSFHGDKFAEGTFEHGKSFSSIKNYSKYFVISEHTYKEFNDFDKIFSLYCSYQHPINQLKQSAYDLKRHLKNLFAA